MTSMLQKYLIQCSIKSRIISIATRTSQRLASSSVIFVSRKYEQKSFSAKNVDVKNLFGQRRDFSFTKIAFNEVITIETPAFAESIKEGEVKLIKNVGDSVAADEVVAQVETDKTTLDVKSPQAGVIESVLVENNSVIGPFAKLFTLRAGAAPAPSSVAAATPVPAAPKPAAEAQPAPVAPPKPVEAPKAPAALSRPISEIAVTPVNFAAMSGKMDIAKISGTRAEARVKMSRMRQTVATRLKDSQNTCAMLTTFNEINMGNVSDLRKSHGEAFLKKHKLKLGFMSAFVKASSAALLDQPVVNAVIDGNEIVYRDYVDISVAVATPKGLVVPVLRNVEKMNYADIEKEIAALGEKARDNKLAVEDMQGGTFTISNGGVFGSMFGTPIINLPQSAILGMHAIFDRPVAINGQVVIKPMMYVALTYDHRLIDGREAVTFLKKIKSSIEDPRTLLLDL